MHFLIRVWLLVMLFALAGPPPAAEAQDRYYLWIFSSQSVPKRAKYSHTWATWARVPGDQAAGPRRAEVFTISWLPATLKIYVYRFRPETGVNLPLDDTLRLMHSLKERISVWGPYEIPADLYYSGLRQKARLEGGEVLYQAIDPIFTNPQISDCIHAVSDTDPYHNRALYTEGLFFGESAGRQITREFRKTGLIHRPCEDLSWLEEALGFPCYPIVRRHWPGP
jgi:hypothetical protein